MNSAVYGKTMENLRKHRDIKLVATEKKKKKELFSIILSNYFFSENILAIEMKKAQIHMNKPVY